MLFFFLAVNVWAVSMRFYVLILDFEICVKIYVNLVFFMKVFACNFSM